MQDAHDSIHITLFLFCLLYFQKFFVQNLRKKSHNHVIKQNVFFSENRKHECHGGIIYFITTLVAVIMINKMKRCVVKYS